jgi:hypothetical protein
MPTLPGAIATMLGAFAPLLSTRGFERAKLLLVGAMLAPGTRPVTAGWRVLGRSDDRHVQT